MRGRRSELVGFRFPQELRRRWRTYLALVLLLGLVGGVALGSIAAARTTQSSFPAFLKTTNPSDLDIDNGPYDPALLRRVAKLPGVTSVQTYVAVNIAPVHPDGTADVNNPFGEAEAVGTLSKLYISQDKITIIDGRMLDPRRPDEIVVSKFFADMVHLHVGQRVPVGVFSNAQITSEGVPATPAAQRLTLTIVGIGVFNDEVVQDDVDKIPRYVVSPVLARRAVGCCVTYAWSGVQLAGGAAAVPRVLHEYVSRLGSASLLYIHITSTIEGQAERAVKPLSLALGVFGLIAGAAALLIAAQLIARVVRTSGGDREVLRALGGDPVDTTADGLLGVAAALLLGTLLAGIVAVALSPLAPFGPVREVLGPRGLSFDWTVLGLGMAALLVGLLLIALLLSYRVTPHRLARRGGHVVRGSRVVDAAASSGLPAPAVAGIRFALTRGGGRNDAPVRSAILGTLLAVVVVVASLTFADSLDTLVSHPALYGWNWNYSLTANAGYGDVPAAAAAKALRADRSVAAWAGAYYALLDIDGESVPVLGANPHAALGPSQLSGHGLDGAGQVVLGSETLQDLHKKIGDTVVVDDGKTQTRLTIVGTATMPTVGVGHGLHLSMGTGAVLDYHVIPAIERNIQGESVSGPNVIFVRFRHGVNQTAALAALQRVANEVNQASGSVGNDLLSGVQHPAEIVNYRAMGWTPGILAAALGLGSVVALGLTVSASVRRRRRELALFKTFGFTRRQLAASVAWQASVAVGIGTVVGIPLGIVAGRWLWTVFADELYAVPQPTVPTVWVVLVAVGALVLANAVAYFPGRQAARVSTAIVLRAE